MKLFLLFLLILMFSMKSDFGRVNIQCGNIMIDRIFLLTLPSSRLRRSNFLKSFNQTGCKIPLEIIWGINTKIPKNAEPYRSLVVPVKFNQMYLLDSGKKDRKTMSDFNSGALGCYLGHMEFYKKSEGLNYTMIFEDNVILSDYFMDELNEELKRIPDDFDVCFFNYSQQKSSTVIRCNKTIQKVKKIMSTKCYLINVKKVKKYYPSFFPIDTHVDLKYAELIKQGLNVYLIPFKSIYIDNSGGSTIGHTKVILSPLLSDEDGSSIEFNS